MSYFKAICQGCQSKTTCSNVIEHLADHSLSITTNVPTKVPYCQRCITNIHRVKRFREALWIEIRLTGAFNEAAERLVAFAEKLGSPGLVLSYDKEADRLARWAQQT